ncbi:MAG: RHS repeat-associated core domain-containing protein [Chryseobacterium sp.]|nr:RHS repeat-associated core domain-containing protein [Chryseobacterium sp.]
MKKHILPIGLLFLTVSSFAQTIPSSSENYVYTKTYLSKTGDPIQKPPIEIIQYFDGLGRPKQVVNVRATPLGNDTATFIEYDPFGRQTKDYLPVPQSFSANGSIFTAPIANAPNIYGSEKIYAEKIVENSPLDRVQQQIQVGNAWSGKPIKFDYEANKSTDKVMRFWSNVNWPNQNNNDLRLEASKYFGDNQLYKNTVTDEDKNVSIEFKNGEGQTLLVRKVLTPTQSADTYYVYDEYNRLSFVISPEASQKLDAAVAGGGSALDPATRNIIDNLCYQYKYDGRNRLIEKKLPGKGWEYMVYDKQDRLIFTQDANLGTATNPFGAKGWLFTKYDQFGRVVYTGFVASGDDRAAVQNIVDTSTTIISNNETRSSSPTSYNGLDLYYNNTAFPTVITKLLSVNYYDSYPVGTGFPSGNKIQGIDIITDTPNAGTQNVTTRSLPTASFVKNIEDDKWTRTYTFYDQKGRPVGTHSYNHLGGYTKSESVLDFTGVVQKTMTYHKRTGVNAETIVEENFTYDHQNRLTKHTHKVGSNAPVTLAQNKYNEIGQLTEKKVGGDQNGNDPLQTVDYSYNIRGWLTSVNDPSGKVAMGSDLFGYRIRYNEQVAGLQTPSVGYPTLQVTPRYNGNIAEIDWNAVEGTGAEPMDSPYRYGYVYDGLNRLLAGFYQDPSNPAKGTYNEVIELYDLNGNIRNLKRFAYKSKSTMPALIDNLTYTYTGGGNRVTNIADATNNVNGYEGGNGLIEYDPNGNMTRMPDKGISAITYNYLNLPKEIAQVNNTKYYYRADGVKIRKAFTLNNASGSNTSNTEYLDGFQYVTSSAVIAQAFQRQDDQTMSANTAAEEETFVSRVDEANAVPQPQTTMVLSFFPTAEGFYDVENSKYIWQYKDHLGNVRLSYAKDATGSIEVLDRNDYYPFGMNFNNYYSKFDAMGSLHNYKFQEQELQETGFYAFKWRNYMPDVGRFFNVDPLAEKYTHNSTYAFSENRVVDARELEGLEAKLINENTVEWKTNVITGTTIASDQISSHLQEASNILSKNGFTINLVYDSNSTFTIDMSKPFGEMRVQPDGSIHYVAGKVSNIGNPLDQTISSDGTARTTAHEIGHAAGLEHAFNGTQITNTPENKENIMNSSANPIKELQSETGTNVTQKQTDIMKSTITASQSRLDIIEQNKLQQNNQQSQKDQK